MERLEEINLLELGAKCRSKYELYRLLTWEANLFLPPYKEWSVEFITDYLQGKKVTIRYPLFLSILFLQVLNCREVTIKSLPQIDWLTAEDLYLFLVEHCEAEDFLPKLKKRRFPNRQWLSSLCTFIVWAII